MCLENNNKPFSSCKNYNGYEEWFKNSLYTDQKIPDNIELELITNGIINKLKQTFFDFNITKNHKKCCEYYKISW